MGQVDGHFGDEDIVGAHGDAGEAGDPARVAAHRLDDHDPAVAFGGGAEAVDRLGHDVDGGVEAECEVGDDQVVVDGLGDADHGDAEVFVEADRHPQRVVAADRDQGVQPRAWKLLADGGQVGLGVLVGVGARRAEDGATAGDDAVGLGDVERASSCSGPGPRQPSRMPMQIPPRCRSAGRRRGSRRSSRGSHRRR